jgi:hypothetical protein
MLSKAKDATKRTWCIFSALRSAAYAAWRSGTTWAASSPDQKIAQSRMITVLAVSTVFKLLSEALILERLGLVIAAVLPKFDGSYRIGSSGRALRLRPHAA